MRPARPTYPLVVLPLVVLLAPATVVSGCSSAPTPRAWAASVCTALAPWRTEISTLTSRTQQQMTAATTPAQAKENLMRMFGGAQDASEKARAGVQKAGVPDVAHGAQVAQSFTASLGAVRDAYGRAKVGVEGLATAPAKTFYAQVATVVDRLNHDYATSELDTSKLDSKELQEAFDEVPECR